MSYKNKHQGVVNGDTDIGKLYEDYQDGLKGYIASQVSYKEDVEDILQNVFYNLAKIDLVENPIEQISSWLYSVAKHQIIDRRRKKKEERFSESEDGEDNTGYLNEISDILSDPGDTPEMQYLQTLFWEELETALNELPEEQRVVFELTEIEGFSFKEISQFSDIPVNTLISRKRYAVLHLRKRLKDLYDEILEK